MPGFLTLPLDGGLLLTYFFFNQDLDGLLAPDAKFVHCFSPSLVPESLPSEE